MSMSLSVPRVVYLAFFVWLVCVLYSHSIFVAIIAPSDNHNQQNIDDGLQGLRRRDFTKGTRLTSNRKTPGKAADAIATADSLSQSQAQEMCDKSKNPKACIHHVLAISDPEVAQTFAKLLLKSETDSSGPNNHNHITMHDAKIACALAEEKSLCIHDVFGTGDLEMADAYEQYKPDLHARHHQKMNEQQAAQTCKIFHPDDQKWCQEQVLGMNDADTAHHFIHLLQDEERGEKSEKDENSHLDDEKNDASENDSKLTQEEIQNMCAPHQEQHPKCVESLQSLPNKHIAEHYVDLLGDSKNGKKDTVSQRDAEKLCNHLSHRHQRPACIKDLTQRNALDAALHYTQLFENHDETHQQRPHLSKKEAAVLCAPLDLPEEDAASKKCLAEVQTINNEDTAKLYVNLLLDQV